MIKFPVIKTLRLHAHQSAASRRVHVSSPVVRTSTNGPSTPALSFSKPATLEYCLQVHAWNHSWAVTSLQASTLSPVKMSESLSTIILLLTLGLAAQGAVLLYFLFCYEEDDSLPVASPPRPSSTSTTPLLYPSYNSYSRGQTNTRTFATYGHHPNFYHSNRSPNYAGHSHRASSASTGTHAQPPYLQAPNSARTQPSHLQPTSSNRTSQAAAKAKATRGNDFTYHSDLVSHPRVSRRTTGTSTRPYASHPPQMSPTRVAQSGIRGTTTMAEQAHRTGLTSHYVAESGRTASTSTRAQASFHQLPTDNRVAGARVRIQASITTADYDGHGCRPTLASSRVEESRETLATRTHVPPPSQSSTAPVGQSTASTTTPTVYANGVHHPSPYSGETSLTGLVPSLTQAVYHSPDVSHPHAFEDAESRPAHSHALPSSSGSGHPGITSSTRVVPLSLSRVLNAQPGVDFEAATTIEDMKAAIALRERARRSNREMREARDLAKAARKRNDHTAAGKHRQDASAHESEMKCLDKRAAKIIFRENNKVRGSLSPCQSHAQPR